MILNPLLLLACIATAPAPSGVTVPDPAASTVPSKFVFCPGGDLEVRMTIRDFAHRPVDGSLVALVFDRACFPHCANPLPSDVTDVTYDESNRRFTAITDVD